MTKWHEILGPLPEPGDRPLDLYEVADNQVLNATRLAELLEDIMLKPMTDARNSQISLLNLAVLAALSAATAALGELGPSVRLGFSGRHQ